MWACARRAQSCPCASARCRPGGPASPEQPLVPFSARAPPRRRLVPVRPRKWWRRPVGHAGLIASAYTEASINGIIKTTLSLTHWLFQPTMSDGGLSLFIVLLRIHAKPDLCFCASVDSLTAISTLLRSSVNPYWHIRGFLCIQQYGFVHRRLCRHPGRSQIHPAADKCASLAHAACRQPRPAPDRVGV